MDLSSFIQIVQDCSSYCYHVLFSAFETEHQDVTYHGQCAYLVVTELVLVHYTI